MPGRFLYSDMFNVSGATSDLDSTWTYLGVGVIFSDEFSGI